MKNIQEIELKRKTVKPTVKISSPTCIEDHFRNEFEKHSNMFLKEVMAVYLLNRNNQIIGYKLISIGSSVKTVFDCQDICRTALLTGAQSVILSHNHPSGKLKPSKEDIKLTIKLQNALKLFDINLLDHVIVTSFDSLSMRENGDI